MRVLIHRSFICVFFFLFNIFTEPSLARTQRAASGLVVSDSPLATKAGMEMLDRGGNAVDAAIATAFALAVVDQASSGIGGGGFMVIYQAKERRAHALDFRETAPEGSRKEQYMKDGKPVSSLSLTGALAVAVPGEVAGLTEAHKRFGSMPLQVLVAPAIRLAAEGFPLDSTLRYAIDRQQESIKKFPGLGRIYMPNHEVPNEGDVIRQPELAETLKAIASQGANAFYQGWVADAIVETIRSEGGVLSSDDLKSYQASMAGTSHRQLSPAHRHYHAAAQLGRRGDFANAQSSRRLPAERIAAQLGNLSPPDHRDHETCIRRSRAIFRRSGFRQGTDCINDVKRLRRVDSQVVFPRRKPIRQNITAWLISSPSWVEPPISA